MNTVSTGRRFVRWSVRARPGAAPLPAGAPGRAVNPAPARKRNRGQTVVEYLLVVSLFALAVAVGPDSPLERFFDAVGERYARFTQTISLP